MTAWPVALNCCKRVEKSFRKTRKIAREIVGFHIISVIQSSEMFSRSNRWRNRIVLDVYAGTRPLTKKFLFPGRTKRTTTFLKTQREI